MDPERRRGPSPICDVVGLRRTSSVVALGAAAIAAAGVRAGGGHRCDDATVVPGLPFLDTGDTGLLGSDYAPACPFDAASGATAPDAVYQYTPAHDENVTISLCGSWFDTRLSVYAGSCPGAGTIAEAIACSDDDCYSGAARTMQSHLPGIALAAGVTYYIIVDGHLGASSAYVLRMWSSCAGCGAEAMLEDEPGCGLDDAGQPADTLNGGCNSLTPLFLPIAAGETVCGTGAVDDRSGARDTDWYELAVPQSSMLTWRVTADHRAEIGIVEGGTSGCAGSICFRVFTEVAPCNPTSLTTFVPAGTWWLFVASSITGVSGCSLHYTATAMPSSFDIDGDGAVGAGDFVLVLSTWGACAKPACPADMTGDGAVGINDLLALLAAWST